jgi:ribosomal protein L7/L12
MDNLEQEVRFLLEQGKKIEAVKRVVEQTGKGLKESKDYVDALMAESSAGMGGKVGVSQETLAFEVRHLVERGRKIEAIKRVRELSGMGLKEAKDFVDSL